jgi:hypothetical protein
MEIPPQILMEARIAIRFRGPGLCARKNCHPRIHSAYAGSDLSNLKPDDAWMAGKTRAYATVQDASLAARKPIIRLNLSFYVSINMGAHRAY